MSDITAILTSCEQAIRGQLDDPYYRENFLPGLAPAEQEQFERNVDALRRRLTEIPGEDREGDRGDPGSVRRPAAPDVSRGGDFPGTRQIFEGETLTSGTRAILRRVRGRALWSATVRRPHSPTGALCLV